MDIGGIISNLGHNPLQRSGQMPADSSKPNLEEMVQRLIEAKDKDNNGTLGAAEVCISDELFQRIDANSDGQLSAEELVEAAKQAQEAMGSRPVMPMMKQSGSDEDDQEQTILDILAQDEEQRQTRIDLMF